MHQIIHLSVQSSNIFEGVIHLNGSKSIANRLLLIQALANFSEVELTNLPDADDTQTMQHLLQQFRENRHEMPYNTGAAGTTFRFLTAFFAFQSNTQILTGSERMKERPIGVLVDALRELGAEIQYLEKEGFPPLAIHQPIFNKIPQIYIAADTSSQYISALLMLAPTLPFGLTLHLEGKIVSRPYILMTLGLMQTWGVNHTWVGDKIEIQAQGYSLKNAAIEADWSAASYWYSMAIIANNQGKKVNLALRGLFQNSLQADSIITEIAEELGITTEWTSEGIILKNNEKPITDFIEIDFSDCPDIAQTLIVTAGALGIQGLFSGMETLHIKETDRLKALEIELAKVQVWLSKLPPRFNKKRPNDTFYMLEGKAVINSPTFATYHDHRMAMAFAPLALLGDIQIENPEVVTKSYPNFWRDVTENGVNFIPN